MSELSDVLFEDDLESDPFDQEDLSAVKAPIDPYWHRDSVLPIVPDYYLRLDRLAAKNQQIQQQNMSASVSVISANSFVTNVASLATYVVSQGFEPGEGYRGPTFTTINDPLSQEPIPAVRLAGQVVLPRYPSSSGFADIAGYFLGGLMSQGRCPVFPGLELQKGTYGTNPMIYYIRNGLDRAIVPGIERGKAGLTTNRRARRAVHQSNSPTPTRSIMEVRPEKYTLKSLEGMFLTALAPWLAVGREFFDLPYTIRFDLSKISTEAALIKYCAALCTPAGVARINLLESALVQGSIQHTNHGRIINVESPTVVGQISVEQEVVPQQ